MWNRSTDPALNWYYKYAQGGLVLRPITREDLHDAAVIWNSIVAEGRSFHGGGILSDEEAWAMFEAQTATVCAVDGDKVVGVYILHPNNIGRCGHIANASYAARADKRGCGVGWALVMDCIAQARAHGFRGLQFNAVWPAIRGPSRCISNWVSNHRNGAGRLSL